MRDNYLNWDEYFMGISLLSSMRSKDPQTQVGACIINEDQRIVGIGYNGFPRGCSDVEFPWERSGEFLETKYPYVVHAEQNAILNSTTILKNCKMYVSLFPCHECAKNIIQSGIIEVIFLNDKYAHTDSIIASKRMLDSAGIKYRQMNSISLSINLENEFSEIEHH